MHDLLIFGATRNSGWLLAGAARRHGLSVAAMVRPDSPAEAPPPTRIETDWLALDLERNRARSTAAVTVTRPGLTMRGTGLEADFDRQQVSLLSQVRTHYVPHD